MSPDLVANDLYRLVGVETVQPLLDDVAIDLGDRHGPAPFAHYLLDGLDDGHTVVRSRLPEPRRPATP